jgi:hypothetical protein
VLEISYRLDDAPDAVPERIERAFERLAPLS